MRKNNTFEANCQLYGFSTPSIKNEMYHYKTPGLKEYCEDIHSYMNFIGPIITQGIQRNQEDEYKKKIISREFNLSQTN